MKQRQKPNRADQQGGQRPQGRSQRRSSTPSKSGHWLYGLHPVAAALANPQRDVQRLLITAEAAETLASKIDLARHHSVSEQTDRAALDHLLGRDCVHQGVALLAEPLPRPDFFDTIEKGGPILVLDQVTDPRNVGAILRSAAAFGAKAVIVQDRNAPEETGALAKAASGAMEIVPLIRAVNISRTLEQLQKANFWCVGLDAGGGTLDGAALKDRNVALVLGAEGEGLRRLTREHCDEIAGIRMSGVMESLNVSVAASLALYEVTRIS